MVDEKVLEKPTEIWVTFAGLIDLPISRGVLNVFTRAAFDGIRTVHFLIQSQGGDVNEGVFLYNLISGLPMDVIAYNIGFVGSAAATAYLGAKKRIVSPNGVFLLHKVTAGIGRAGNVKNLKAIVDGITLDDARTENIIKAHLSLTKKQFSVHAHSDLYLSAKQSIECGLATQMGDFKPRGPIINI